jgi:hypothetical protein
VPGKLRHLEHLPCSSDAGVPCLAGDPKGVAVDLDRDLTPEHVFAAFGSITFSGAFVSLDA